MAVDGTKNVAAMMTLACRWADALGFSAGHSERISVRDVIRVAPAGVTPSLKAAAVEIGQRCRAKLLEFARELNQETAKPFAKL
jgi:hypothetical protein